MNNEPLFGKTLSELQDIVKDLGLPKFTAGQLTDWLYKKKISHIDQMTNLSINARESLNESYVLGLSEPVNVQVSTDGTKKYLFNSSSEK